MGTQTEVVSADDKRVVLDTQDGLVEYVPGGPRARGGCDGCAFHQRHYEAECRAAPCEPWERADTRRVIWVEVSGD